MSKNTIKINNVNYNVVKVSDEKTGQHVLILTENPIADLSFSYDASKEKAVYATAKDSLSQFFLPTSEVDSKGKTIYARISFGKKIKDTGKSASDKKLVEI